MNRSGWCYNLGNDGFPSWQRLNPIELPLTLNLADKRQGLTQHIQTDNVQRNISYPLGSVVVDHGHLVRIHSDKDFIILTYIKGKPEINASWCRFSMQCNFRVGRSVWDTRRKQLLGCWFSEWILDLVQWFGLNPLHHLCWEHQLFSFVPFFLLCISWGALILYHCFIYTCLLFFLYDIFSLWYFPPVQVEGSSRLHHRAQPQCLPLPPECLWQTWQGIISYVWFCNNFNLWPLAVLKGKLLSTEHCTEPRSTVPVGADLLLRCDLTTEEGLTLLG